jgi:hypothetical protein
LGRATSKGEAVTRQQEQMILRLWRDWCRLWPEQYGHESLQVKVDGYDPVFDVIPSQAYKDFFFEVVRGHPHLKNLNAFEVVDAALNQVRAPEAPWLEDALEEPRATPLAAPYADRQARVVGIELARISAAEFDEPEADSA